jgi:hypothetical protein
MTGPLKRSAYRASPEDAAFYRRFHDVALSSLRKGVPREELLGDLLTRGVPEKTAERIVMAVEQEHGVAIVPKAGPRGKRWVIALAVVAAFGCTTVYLALQMSEDRTLQAKYLVPAILIALVLSAIVIQRLLLRVRGPEDLPPPPDQRA